MTDPRKCPTCKTERAVYADGRWWCVHCEGDELFERDRARATDKTCVAKGGEVP